MFNVVEKHQKIVKGIMIAVTATFVLWGIGGYLGMMGDDGYVAKVGKDKIYAQDIDRAMQGNPQNTDKMQVLFGLINRQLLINNIRNYNLAPTKQKLQDGIAKIPEFQESGAFNLKKYKAFLSNRLMSAQQFQHNMQQQLIIDETVNFFKGAYFSSALFNQKFAALLSRERKVASYTIDPQKFYSQINIKEKEIADYYKQNIAQFTLPQQVKVQYIQLGAVSAANSIKISDNEINVYLKEHAAQANNEQIDASHILFTVPATADAKTRNTIKAKAKSVLEQVKAHPNMFAKYATQYSQDQGSAKNGGNLGFFSQGVMVKPFEEIAFNLKPGQISDLVETQYGYHIIKVNKIKGNSSGEARNYAIAQLQKQKATGVLQKDLEQLNDLTYNQPKSLVPAATKLGLTIESSGWITKGMQNGPFANPKVQAAIFSNDVLKNRNNSEVIELGDGNYAVYHITDYQVEKIQPIADVTPQIINQLKTRQAQTMAYQEGQKDVALLQQGKLKLNFTNPESVNLLAQNPRINQMTVKQIFATALNKLPAYTGSVNDKGVFVIYQISGESVNKALEVQNQKMLQQFNSNIAMLDFGAYLAVLKQKYDVSYRMERLNTKPGADINN